MTAVFSRSPEHPVADLFVKRWSPRAFSGEPIDQPTLFSLFEAARWAPSAYNAQPWRFVYALRESPAWPRFLDLLSEKNRRWAANASALVFLLSQTVLRTNGEQEPTPLPTHSFDAGAAWASLAFQAEHLGLRVHAIGGFDRDRARDLLEVPDDYKIEIVIAIGHQSSPDQLPEDLRAREQPSQRNPLTRLVAEGRFSFAD